MMEDHYFIYCGRDDVQSPTGALVDNLRLIALVLRLKIYRPVDRLKASPELCTQPRDFTDLHLKGFSVLYQVAEPVLHMVRKLLL